MMVGMETLPSIEEVAELHGRDLDAVLRAAERVRREAEAVIAAAVERCDATMHYVADGHRSVKQWAMAVTNCSPNEARVRRNTARVFALMPKVGAGLRAGTLGVAQVHELARLARNPRCREHLPASEGVLLDAARSLPFVDFRTVVQRWEALADPDGAELRHERAHTGRTASLTHVDGVFQWRTSHGVFQGTVMQEVFDAFVQAQWEADWAECVALHGAAACPALMSRTSKQRRADAMVAIFEAAATAGVDGMLIAINVNLLMDVDQYEQRLADGVAGTGVDVDPATVRDRRCETTDGVPFDPRVLVALSLLGHVRRVVVNAAGVVVNAGQKRRLFDGALAEVIRAIEPRCLWLGCTIRAAIAQIDHLISYSAGGPTDADNAGVMCEHHNLFKYRSGFDARRRPDGTWVITRPDGTVLRPPDAGAA